MEAGASQKVDAEAPEQDAEISDLSQLHGAPGNSAVDRVTAEVRRLVLNGSMAPGSSFSIADLSDRLRVSAIPVREALRRLDAQGLILLRPGRSAIVNPLDVDELRGIYRLRRAIDPTSPRARATCSARRTGIGWTICWRLTDSHAMMPKNCGESITTCTWDCCNRPPRLGTSGYSASSGTPATGIRDRLRDVQRQRHRAEAALRRPQDPCRGVEVAFTVRDPDGPHQPPDG